MFHSFLAFQKMFAKIVGLIKKIVTARASKALKETIYIVCMNHMVVKSQ